MTVRRAGHGSTPDIRAPPPPCPVPALHRPVQPLADLRLPDRQRHRFLGTELSCNAQMAPRELRAFCKLGAGLFDDAGNIAGEVKFSDLAAHVFFTETGVPIPKRSLTWGTSEVLRLSPTSAR